MLTHKHTDMQTNTAENITTLAVRVVNGQKNSQFSSDKLKTNHIANVVEKLAVFQYKLNYTILCTHQKLCVSIILLYTVINIKPLTILYYNKYFTILNDAVWGQFSLPVLTRVTSDCIRGRRSGRK